MNVAYMCFDRGIPALGNKGASVHVREFIHALAARRHRVALICARLGIGNPFPPARLIEIVPEAHACDSVQSTESAKLAYNDALPERTLAALAGARIKPDLIYERSTLFCDAGAAIAASVGAPRILEVNAPLVQEQATHRGLHLETIATEMERRSYLSADHVIAVSNQVAAHVEAQGVSRERITVLPNGVDTRRFSPNIDGSRLRTRLNAERRPVVGFVGSLKPWHGVHRLLDVFASGAVRRHNPLLMIVGSGPEYERLRSRVARDGLESCVIFTGNVPYAEVPEYLAAMDFTVAPYEAQSDFYFSPMKIVESLAAGRPVVAPALGQIPSLIEHLETGFVYDPHASCALVDALLYLLDREYECCNMGVRAAARVRAHRTWAHNVATVEAILQTINERGGHRAS